MRFFMSTISYVGGRHVFKLSEGYRPIEDRAPQRPTVRIQGLVERFFQCLADLWKRFRAAIGYAEVSLKPQAEKKLKKANAVEMRWDEVFSRYVEQRCKQTNRLPPSGKGRAKSDRSSEVLRYGLDPLPGYYCGPESVARG